MQMFVKLWGITAHINENFPFTLGLQGPLAFLGFGK